VGKGLPWVANGTAPVGGAVHEDGMDGLVLLHAGKNAQRMPGVDVPVRENNVGALDPQTSCERRGRQRSVSATAQGSQRNIWERQWWRLVTLQRVRVRWADRGHLQP